MNKHGEGIGTNATSNDPFNPSGQEFNLSDLFHVLWFRRRLLIATTLFIVGIGMLVIYQLKPLYTATSSVIVEIQKTRIGDIDSVLNSVSSGRSSAVFGEMQLMQSREQARKLVTDLDLLSLEEFNPALRPVQKNSFSLSRWVSETVRPLLGLPEKAEPIPLSDEVQQQRRESLAVNIFLSKLRIRALNSSDVINISFESLDPELAARVANELPDAYIIGKMEAKFKATEKATKWLNEQLADLKDKVEQSEEAVEFYRSQYGLVETGGGSGVVSEQLSAINSQLIIARAERAQATARLRKIQQLMKAGGSGVESAPEVLSSPLIQRLREQQAVVMRKVSELSTEYGAKHPKMLQVRAEISDIKNNIKLEIEKIAAGLANEADIARSREQSLAKSLEELKQTTGVQKRESVQLRALEREAEANRALYETFLGKFKIINSTSGMQEADARIISRAEVPRGASFPNTRLLLMMTLFGGLGVAVALVFIVQILSPGLLNPEQVEHELGIPAIGLIPRVSKVSPQDYVLKKPHSSYGEALNSLKTSLILSGPDKAVKTIQITSSIPEEGKSTLALSFARLLAQSGKKVILVDADLRRASLEKKLGVSASRKGLTDLVIAGGSTDLSDYIFKDEKSKVIVLPKGSAEYVNASDVFSSQRMESIIASLRNMFDYVIFDTPPVMAVSDARILGRLVDKTVFVVHWDKTPVKVIKAAIKELKSSGVDIAGCVLQQVNLKRYGRYGHGDSGYYYHYGKYGQYYSS